MSATYYAIRFIDPAYPHRFGKFMGGPSGTSSAPHLYLSAKKARAKSHAGCEVVPVRLVEVDEA